MVGKQFFTVCRKTKKGLTVVEYVIGYSLSGEPIIEKHIIKK